MKNKVHGISNKLILAGNSVTTEVPKKSRKVLLSIKESQKTE